MKFALKRLQSLVAVTLCVFMTMAFTSCSDDDDEPGNKSLAGTSWIILSNVDDSNGMASDEIVGLTMSFQKDGNIKFTPAYGWTYAKWSLSGNVLKLILGEDEADDYMEGTLVINGNNATYKYSWYDCDGKWGGDDHYTMTLQKK